MMLSDDAILEVRATVPTVQFLCDTDLQVLASDMLSSDRGKMLAKAGQTPVQILLHMADIAGFSSILRVIYPMLIVDAAAEADMVSAAAFLEGIGSDRSVDLALVITFCFPHALPRPVLPRCCQPQPALRDHVIVPLEQLMYAAIARDRPTIVRDLLLLRTTTRDMPLYEIAARLGATQCLAVLLLSANDNHRFAPKQDDLDRALCNAASHGHVDCVDQLFQAGANLQAYGDDPVRCAILNGHFHVSNWLKERSLALNTLRLVDFELSHAARHGNIDVVNCAFLNGGNALAFDAYGLQHAISAGHTCVVRRILQDTSFDRARLSADWWKKALSDAISACHVETVRYVCMSGLSVLTFREVLSLAVGIGSVAVVTALLGDIVPLRGNLATSDLEHFFLLACRFGHVRLTDMMLDKFVNAIGSCDSNRAQNIKIRGLIEACERGCLEAVLFLLIERGVPASGSGNEKPLRAAIDNRHWRVAEVLIQHGADTAVLQAVRARGPFKPISDLARWVARATHLSSASDDGIDASVVEYDM